MERTNVLRDICEDLTAVYGDERIPVEFDRQPAINEDGDQIYVWAAPGDVLGIDVDGPNEFRIIRDSINHEVAHARWSDLSAKSRFSAMFDNRKYNRVAGTVYNILEDAYIDARRVRERPGLRRARSFFVHSQMDAKNDISDKSAAEAMIEGLHQIALSGRANGMDDVDDDVREFLSWARRYIAAYRDEDDRDARHEIGRRVAVELVDRLEPADDIENVLDDIEVTVADGDERDPHAEPLPDDVELPDDIDLPDEPGDMEPADDDDAGSGLPAGDDESEPDGVDDDDGAAGGGESHDGDEEPGDDDGNPGGNAPETGESDPADDADDESGGAGGDDDGDLWDDLDDPDDVDDEPSRSDRRRYERVQDAMDEIGTDIGKRKQERDNAGDASQLYNPADELVATMDETGLVRDIRRAFERFKSRDVVVPGESGDTLNVGNVVRHMAGDYQETRVYNDRYTAATGGRTIGVTIDLSGSMKYDGHLGSGAIADAKIALAALAHATEAMGDQIIGTGFAESAGDVELPLITNAGESWDWDHLDTVGAMNMTPTAHAVADMEELLLDAGGRERVMIVVTDGDPTWTFDGQKAGYGLGSSDDGPDPEDAQEDAAERVEHARANGIKVIGMAVGGDVLDDAMETMFGDMWVRTTAENLVDELVGIYEDQLDIERPAGY